MRALSLDFRYDTVDQAKYPPVKQVRFGAEVEEMNPITVACIWATMSVDYGNPMDNPDEWVFRVQLYEKIAGASVFDYDEETGRTPHYLTVEELLDHVGITTNVINKARSTFLKKIADFEFAETKRKVAQYEKELAP